MDYSHSKNEFTRYRYQLGYEKSKRYMKWMKRKFPRLDLHHILGSFSGKKMTDFLLVPLNHSYHINTVEKEKGKHFLEHLDLAIKYLKQYIKEELKQNLPKRQENGFEPEIVQKLIDIAVKGEITIYELDKR